jgi:FkbM family methyltransferase
MLTRASGIPVIEGAQAGNRAALSGTSRVYLINLKTLIHRILRALGWEVQRLRNANVEYQVLRDVFHYTGVSVLLDVGANVGQYGDLAFAAGFRGTLISFEAIPSVHGQLSKHAKKSGRSWIVAPCAALGSEEGTTFINISANSVSSSVLPMQKMHLNAAPDSKYIRREPVRIARLDGLTRDLLPAAGTLLIKVDTQGYEMEVMKGAAGLLQRTAALQLEISLAPLYEGAPTYLEMLSFVNSLGFRLFGIIPGFKDSKTGQTLQIDAIFVRGDRGETVAPTQWVNKS